jgi:PiT family inorganic phosphate transporter
MHFGSIGALQFAFLIGALALAFGFECVNGFHDTANAVATVIYTNALPPVVAVVWSGIWNLIGVLTSNGAVAFSVVALLPAELILNVNSAAGIAMIFALLVSAIIWNLGTWYLGLPASSSHTMIGAIMGVGLMNSMLHGGGIIGGVNWAKAEDVGLALLLSPVLGFLGTALLFTLAKAIIRDPALYAEPVKGKPPPPWIRGLLCLTCTGVSFAHGSNDGQKGMGLIVLILIAIIPGVYALNPNAPASEIESLLSQAKSAQVILAKEGPVPASASAAPATLSAYLQTGGAYSDALFPALSERNQEIIGALDGIKSFEQVPQEKRIAVRDAIYSVAAVIAKMNKSKALTNAAEAKALGAYGSALDATSKFIPLWVQVGVAISLGIGTMIGWKRIVVTVGEKIGKAHLTYAQGASAELVAWATIGLATSYGLPVSTTHVLSSGVAGAMAANHSGLQTKTLRNIVMAWVLTLPVCMFLGALIFAASLVLLGHLLGAR